MINYKSLVKWQSAESSDGERSVKQHAFIGSKRRMEFTNEEYEGNMALCDHSAGLMNEWEMYDPIEKIQGEPMKENCCKRCKKIYQKLTPLKQL